ncbi:YheC/YheD family protein [Cohnella endophytica]|uniref:YheC/YheD family protein n=1 Tax=Cohnella endophytica TaxID=2419778 RepID=A0A494Y1M1_9BACL|nr:YheC/YheD family protein [Cohnella endophytica]RKP56141.1 YheC/YheD family protein [Cohnella endophytica]
MKVSISRQLASKWTKTNALLSDPYIARHIPSSRLLNAENLRRMLSKYGMVVVKPVRGAGGIGVIKIERSGSSYRMSHKSHKNVYSGFNGLMRGLNTTRRKRSYLIQRGIQLATIDGRPIDYRVKYVKEKGSWTYRSMVGRVAKPGLFVTNLCRGGTLVTAAFGIRKSLSARLVGTKKREMRHLTKASTALLESRFPGIGQLGYDYGIDRKGHVWMLEVNTRPQ